MAAEPAEVTANYDCATGSDITVEHVLEDVHEILRLLAPMARLFNDPAAQIALDRVLNSSAMRWKVRNVR